jgi:hypothetical protein
MRAIQLVCRHGLPIAVAIATLAPVAVAGQTPSAANAQTPATTKRWTAPRTPDGQPDLQGVWANNNITPLQRPPQWAGKQFLNDEEVAALKKAAASAVDAGDDAVFGDALVLAAIANSKGRSFEPSTGNYNNFWLVEREVDNRTSLVVDPPDGRLPPLTPEAQKRADALAAWRRLHPADGPEDRSLGERCLTFGAPRVGAGYNSYYQIVQTPGFVAIIHEMGHEVRLIPIDGRPHVGDHLRQWMGDSRGRWEGETLVVETTKFSRKSNFMGSNEGLQLVERFTRMGPTTIKYEFTVNDPTTWTRQWTAMIPLKHTDDQIYEYACHEGNTGLEGILSGHRVEEQASN